MGVSIKAEAEIPDILGLLSEQHLPSK